MSDEVVNELITKYRFSQAAIDICLRAKFKCEYCDHDILELFEDFRFSANDHLLPQSKYEKLIPAESNHVLACHACNMLKSRWDPNVNPDKSLLVALGATSLTFEERSELINRTTKYLLGVRREKKTEFEQYRRLLRQLGPDAESRATP